MNNAINLVDETIHTALCNHLRSYLLSLYMKKGEEK